MPFAGRLPLALRPGPVRALHRQLPERRHPPPAADARARLEAWKAPSCSASRRRAAPAHHAVDAALALPVVRPRDRLVREHPGRELALAARPLLGVPGADLAALSARRAADRRAVRRWSAGASARSRSRCSGALFCAVLVALAGIDWDTTLLPDNLTLPLLWAGLVSAALGWTIAPARRGVGRRRRLSVALVGLLALQADHRQGGHGLRRLQAARRARRVARLEDDPADRARWRRSSAPSSASR